MHTYLRDMHIRQSETWTTQNFGRDSRAIPVPLDWARRVTACVVYFCSYGFSLPGRKNSSERNSYYEIQLFAHFCRFMYFCVFSILYEFYFSRIWIFGMQPGHLRQRRRSGSGPFDTVFDAESGCSVFLPAAALLNALIFFDELRFLISISVADLHVVSFYFFFV